MKHRLPLNAPRSSTFPTYSLVLLATALGLGACDCAVGEPTDRDGATPIDAGHLDAGDGHVERPDSGPACGNGSIDGEYGEVCDPNYGFPTDPSQICECPDDGDNCTEEMWVPDPLTGVCGGHCEHKPRSGYGVNTCDDNDSCTVDTITGGTIATCDVTCTNEPPSQVDDTCDKMDNNCNGSVDEGYVSQPTTCGTGVCASTGMTACGAGGLSDSCTPSAPSGTDNNCNGLDEDCDGRIDEAYPVTQTNCGVGSCSANGNMICVQGVPTNTCVMMMPGATDNNCNGVDEDCDGTADESFPVTSTTCGQGVCASSGMKTCLAGGQLHDSCTAGASTGPDDNCNNLDENCNGVLNDNWGPITTTCGVGVCASTGISTCSAAGVQGTTCVANSPLSPTDSTCNGLDDNCNGVKDEDYVPTMTSCGVGGCAANGLNICVNGATSNTCTPGVAVPEVCDSIDNDCDGTNNDGNPGGGVACNEPTRQGICRPGTTACVGNGLVCMQTVFAMSESCNGLDDNCDGTADNGIVATACSTGELGVCNAGTTTCTAGVPGCQRTTGPSAEVCDALDNNCDGMVNNGVPNVGAACNVPGQQGPCQAGLNRCLATDTSMQCIQQVFPSPEICAVGGGIGGGDGVDNDCNGSVDINPTVNDGNPNTCGTAGNKTINVAVGGNTTVNGVVDVAGSDYLVINFQGATGLGRAYHPRISIASAGNVYTFSLFTNTNCNTAIPSPCGAQAANTYQTFESSYPAMEDCPPGGSGCYDAYGRITSYVVRIQRGAPINCTSYTLTISN